MSEQLIRRRRELSNAITDGREARDREFTMRIPAEPERDADLVLSTAANRIAELDRENERLRTGPLHGKYGNVLTPFVALMERELHANSRKGDRDGWRYMSANVGLLEIYWHTAKLSVAVKNADMAGIREHSADVANMAMMLLDTCGGLDVVADQAREKG